MGLLQKFIKMVSGENVQLFQSSLTAEEEENALANAVKLKKVEKINATVNLVKNTIVIDGDSITAQNFNFNTKNNVNTTLYSATGYFTWANTLLNQAFYLVDNKGIGGDRTDQLLERFQAALDLNTKFVFVNIGKNDIIQGVDTSIIKTNLLEIANRIINNGQICIMSTVIPAAIVNGTEVEDTFEINRYIKSLQNTLDNFICVDFFASIVNPITNLAITDTLVADNIHPSSKGAFYMGREIANKLKDYVISRSIFNNCNGDGLWENQMMTGDNNGIADGWSLQTVSGTSTPTKVLRENNLEWQEVEVDGGIVLVDSLATNIPKGKSLETFIEYEIDESVLSISNVSADIKILDNSYKTIDQSLGLQINSNESIRFPDIPTKGIIVCPKFTIPEEAFRLNIYLRAELVGKIRFGRIHTGVE